MTTAQQEAVFISGLGWVDPASVACATCGDQGYVVTDWEDSGSAESGPELVATDGYYCSCEKGVEGQADADGWDEGYIQSRMNNGQRTRDEALALIEEEAAWERDTEYLNR